MKIIFAGILLSSLATLAVLPAADLPQRKPNVLFIAVDDLRPWIGAMGFPAAKTPNFDRLAERSVVFSRAYTAAPWCNPSRTALLTGLRPSTTGVYAHWDDHWRTSPRLASHETLPQYFRSHGYETVGAGKIFHHSRRSQDPASWDRYWPSQSQCMLEHGLAKPPLNGLDLRRTVDWGRSWLKKTDMPDWKVADFVVKELAKPQDRPRFLACGFYLPHLPWYVPQEYLDRYPLDQVPLPPVKEEDLKDIGSYGRRLALGEGLPNPHDPDDYGSGRGVFETIREAGKWREAVRAYLASISFADDCLGRILDAVEASPGGRETIVCLWSDHGWHLGEKQHWEKVTLWEEATRSVLMISAPGKKQGATCDRVVNIMDLHPTLVDLAGLPARSGLDCRSLVPLLEHPAAAWPHPTLITHGRGNHAVRDERYRYIRYRNGEEELYDHTRDPNEWTNLAADPAHRPIIESLRRHLPKEEAPAITPEFPAKK
jgi:arylsulfatase A-like enzyme